MKKNIAWLLAALLVFSQAAALAQVYKDEVVYAKLDLLGAPYAVYIVNAFETDEEAKQADYGAYTELINLSGTEPLTASDGELNLSLPAGRTYYQGTPEEAELPWDIALSWQLDGQPVADPLELSGAAGQLALTLKVTTKEDMQPIAGGLALQISVPLNADHARNIQAPNATLAWAGGNVTAAYAILPGMGAEYTLTADVENFSMGAMQLAGVRMGMDAAMYRTLVEKNLEGTQLVTVAGNMMDGFIASMAADTQPSFADPRNGDIRSLQFVMLTDEIPAKPVAAEEETLADEPAEGGFVDRLLSLFGG